MDTPDPSVSSAPAEEHTTPPEGSTGNLLRSAPGSASPSLDEAVQRQSDEAAEAPIHETPQHGLALDEPTSIGAIQPTSTEIKAEAAVAYAEPRRVLRFAAIGTALAVCVGLCIFASRQPAVQDPVSSIDNLYGHVSLPFDQLPSPKLEAASTLPDIVAVNGELNIQGSLVLAPTAQPAAPIPGQLYFDQTSNQLSYFNGRSFNALLTTNALPPQQLGLSAGSGIGLASGLLTNAGVLSLQGKSGNISLSAGPGLQIAGTQFSNTGVLSLGGLTGEVVLGNGLSVASGKLSSTGVQSLNTDGSLNISDDGQGNYTITGPMGVGSGNVSTVGGTAGHLAVFNNAQAISDSIISQSGTTVSVAGNLVVTGTISASSYSGDGASITNVNATRLGGQASSYYTNASNLSSGSLNDARLSINVPLLNASNNFTGSLQHNGNAVCDASGNCVGVSGGSIGGGGTANKLTLFTGTGFTVGNSLLSQDAGATTVSIAGDLAITGSVSAISLSGNGGGVTNVNASQLGGQAGSYYTNASNISAGTLNDARLSTNVALKNSATNFTAALQHNGNAVCDASGNCVGVSGGSIGGGGTANLIALFTGTGFSVGNSILSQDVGATTVTVAGNLAANNFSGGGSGLTALNASNLASGTVGDTRLSANVALKNASSNFTASLQHNGNDVCDTSGNCVGSGAGGAIGGSGTLNKIALFTSSGYAIGNSILSQDVGATTVTVGGSLAATSLSGNGAGVTNVNAAQLNGQTASYYLNASNLSAGLLSTARGGTGVDSSLASNGQLLIGNGSGFALGTLTGGAGISISNAAGSITITSTGATGTAGGDLSGSYPNPTVAKIRGTNVSFVSLVSGDVLQYDGTNIVNGHITNSNLTAGTFGAITGTGALSAGSIASGFGTISTANNITTTSTVQGATLNATTGYKLNGTAGSNTTCSGGQVLQNQVVSGGITTGGTCATAGSSGVTTIGALDGGTANATGATITAATLYLQSASASFAGLVNTGSQTFAGNKTFSGTLTGGSTINATTALQTAGTTRIDASGNLSNIGNIAGSGTLQLSGTTGSSYIMSALGLGTSNPQSGAALTTANNSWISSVDAGGSGYINLFKVNGGNEIQVGAAMNVDGGIVLPTNGGQITLSDLPIDSTVSSGTKESYTMRVGSSNALTVYGEADGSGNAQNIRIAVGSSIAPAYTLDVGGDINTTGSYRATGTAGASVTCSGGQILTNQVVAGGITTGGTCAANGSGVTTVGALDGGTANATGATISGTTINLQSASASFAGLVNTGSQTFAGNKTFSNDLTVQGTLYAATVALTDATNMTFTAPDTATDPSIIFNMQCRTGCSGTQGRFAIQSNGVDAFWIGYDTATSATEINVSGGVDIKMGSGTVGNTESALTHDFTCTSSEAVHDIVVIAGVGTVGRTSTANSTAVAGIVVAKPNTTTCSIATAGEAQVWMSSNAANVGNSVSSSAIAGAAQSQSIPSGGQSIGHFMSGKDGSNLAWVLLNGS